MSGVNQIKILLLEQRKSQRRLAFELGLDESILSKLINYGIGPDKVKQLLAQHFGMPVEEIFPVRTMAGNNDCQ